MDLKRSSLTDYYGLTVHNQAFGRTSRTTGQVGFRVSHTMYSDPS